MKKLALLASMSAFMAIGAHPVYSQSLKGKIQVDAHWKPIVYLIEISQPDMLFNGSSAIVIDSSQVGTNGDFDFQGLRKNTLYRLNMVPDSVEVSGAFIQNGTTDNYAYFATANSTAHLYLTANSGNVLRSYQVTSEDPAQNEAQKEIARIIRTKYPIYDLMASLGQQMDSVMVSDPAALENFRMDAIYKIQNLNQQTNSELLSYIKTLKNPETIAFGLMFYGFEQNYFDDGAQEAIMALEPYADRPLVGSLIHTANKITSLTDNSFLSMDYTTIDGKTFKLDTIRSKFILLDFWASWCLPCRKSITTDLKELSLRYSKDDLYIIGISVDDDKEAARQAIEKDKNKALQIWESEPRYLKSLLNVNSLPYYVLIDMGTKKATIVPNVEAARKKIEDLR